jgi:hypothetical protein
MRADMLSDEDSRQIIRAAPATIVIFSVLCSSVPLVALLLFWRGQQLPEAVLLCGIYVGVVSWICSPTVELRPGRLLYRTLFTRVEIDLADVVSASIAANPGPKLELRGPGKGQVLGAFGVKVFSREGVAAILGHVRESSPGVDLDTFAESMRQGRLDLVTRETLRSANWLRGVWLIIGVMVAVGLGRTLLR